MAALKTLLVLLLQLGLLGQTLTASDDGDHATSNCDAGCPPSWEVPEPSVRRMNRISGESVVFQCATFGYPRPTLTWKKNGQMLSMQDQKVQFSHYSITVSKLLPEDSGAYTCFAVNRFGTVSWTFELMVHENVTAGMLEDAGWPTNATVYAGDEARFRCDEEMSEEATITWVKEPDETENSTAKDAGGEPIVLKEASFIGWDTLLLPSVELPDTGCYTCIIKSDRRSIRRSAWLTVLPSRSDDPLVRGVREDGSTYPNRPSTTLHYIKVVAITFGAMVGVLIICMLVVRASALWRKSGKLTINRTGYTRTMQQTNHESPVYV